MFLLQEGISHIKKSIDWIQDKTDIKLGDWVKGKSIKFLFYIAISLFTGTNILTESIQTTEICKTIELFDWGIDYFLKKVLSELKEKFSNFIKNNFIFY